MPASQICTSNIYDWDINYKDPDEYHTAADDDTDDDNKQ